VKIFACRSKKVKLIFDFWTRSATFIPSIHMHARENQEEEIIGSRIIQV